MKQHRKPLCLMLLLILLALLSLSACARGSKAAPTPSPALSAALPEPSESPKTQATEAPVPETPAPTESAPPTAEALSGEAVSELAAIRAMIDGGQYYNAFREMLAFEEKYPEGAARAACEELFGELDLILRELEPASGTELMRTFSVQGGGVLEIDAFSGPVIVTAATLEAPEVVADYVCFYVRQGEVGSVYLPAGNYYVSYRVGYRWFGDEAGFGEYYTEGALEEPLYYDFYMDGQWASNAKYTIKL